MPGKKIGSTLREQRINAKMSVNDVSVKLTGLGFKASNKTIYSWENGNSQPTPDALLALCEIYGISDVLSIFGYKQEKAPAVPQELNEDEMQLITDYRLSAPDDKKLILRTAANATLAASAQPPAIPNTAKAVAEDWLEKEAQAANLPEDTPEAAQE